MTSFTCIHTNDVYQQYKGNICNRAFKCGSELPEYVALILRNGGSQSPDRWLREPRNNHRNLYTWIAEENTPPKTRKEYPVIDNPPDHPRNPPLEVKLNAIHRCYELGENIKYVSEDIGYSRASIYQWRKRYLKEGTLGLMNHKNITPGTLVEGSVSSTDISSDEINQLKAQMQDMQLEIDILKETINVLKKDPDIDQSALSNREKAVIIDVLKNRYSLPLLLQKLQLSKSSYYYQEQSLQKEDKYTLLRVRVIELFTENKGRYGYRRIHALLKRENIIVSEKVIRRIMK